MEAEFWRGRWREGSIGFHEGAPNAYLTTYLGELPGTRVLVPLCGKTEDLAYLASHGREVIGIELVEDAVRTFFAEHAVEPEITRRGVLTQYTAGAVTIFAGDVFAVTRDDVGTIDAIYDRAALVALPPEMRERYVAHLGALAAAATPVLLVTLAYPQDRMQGPPFSVPDAEVRAHYDAVVQLEERPAVGGRASDVGAMERCYRAALRTGPASSAHSS
ncbi:MAG TPA: thiopurine S-methyltransferase [Kofleriaceae bacterium]|jgi:thiopurine S-methyltransferase|nr:thiopurine S-methyltransferase [Kofleriaceae bacterium]